MKRPNCPAELTGAGRTLWKRLTAEYDVSGAESLVTELCKIAQRLHEVRAILDRDGLVVTEGNRTKKHPLCDLEPKLSAQLQKLWKLAGFADTETAEHRGPGAPTAAERALKWRG